MTSGIPVIYDCPVTLNYSSGQMITWPAEASLLVSNPLIHMPMTWEARGFKTQCLKSSKDSGSFPKYLSLEKSLIHFHHLLMGNGSCVSLLRMSKHFPLRFT